MADYIDKSSTILLNNNDKEKRFLAVGEAADMILKGNEAVLFDRIAEILRSAFDISESLGLETAKTALCIVIIAGAEAEAAIAPHLITFPSITPAFSVNSEKDALDKISASLKSTENTLREYRFNDKCSIVERIKEYINTHYEHQIFLTDIADMVCLSQNYIGRIFKEYAKESITDYIHRLRIARAKTLLRETNERISQIAYGIGYRDSNYFSIIFKKNTGLSPKEYREKNTKRSQGVSGEF